MSSVQALVEVPVRGPWGCVMRLLDLFCCAGGAAMGYHQAGFTEIVGVDIEPQPNYPFELSQAIPPAYTKFIGEQFLAQVEVEA